MYWYLDSLLDVGEYIENRILKIELVFIKFYFLVWGFNLVRELFFIVLFCFVFVVNKEIIL